MIGCTVFRQSGHAFVLKKIFENPAGSLPEAARGGKRLFRPETAPRVFVQ